MGGSDPSLKGIIVSQQAHSQSPISTQFRLNDTTLEWGVRCVKATHPSDLTFHILTAGHNKKNQAGTSNNKERHKWK